jgi:hypothetical protein
VGFIEKREFEREMQVTRKSEKRDYYGEEGCCLTCHLNPEEFPRGYQQDAFFEGKHYDCHCDECKCRRCSWYYRGECQRKGIIL